MAEDDVNHTSSTVGELSPSTALEQIGLPEVPPSQTATLQAESSHRHRFVVGYVALGLLLAGAIVGTVLLVQRAPAKQTAAAHNVAAPASSGEELKAIDIADEVSRRYRQANGAKLVDAIASRNTLQDGNLGLLTVRYQVIQPSDAREGDSELVIPADAMQFSLCGAGTNCAIPGTKSVERGLLLRQEALNLALTTFHQLPNVDNVSVFLRPATPPTGYEGNVLLFRRSEVARKFPELMGSSLTQTPSTELKPANLTVQQQQQIDDWTHPFSYAYRYTPLGGRDAAMYLLPQQ